VTDVDDRIVREDLEQLHKLPEGLLQVIFEDPHDQMLVGGVGVSQWAILEIPMFGDHP
jgi:hypothetical protein